MPPDRGDRALVSEALGVPDREVLHPAVAVVDKPTEVGYAPAPDRHLEGVEGARTVQFARTYYDWLGSGKYGTQCFPEAWQPNEALPLSAS